MAIYESVSFWIRVYFIENSFKFQLQKSCDKNYSSSHLNKIPFNALVQICDLLIQALILLKHICVYFVTHTHFVNTVQWCYSWHELFLSGNQSNHHNLVPYMPTYKFWLLFICLDLFDNQKCQAGFRPLCNKILLELT